MDLQLENNLIEDNHNPLDVLETLAAHYDWPYERLGDHEFMAAVSGAWSDFHIRYYWLQDENILQAAGMLDVKIPRDKQAQILEAINLVNENLAMGHFSVWSEDQSIMFRHSHMLDMHDEADSGSYQKICGAVCEKITEAILGECNKYFPVFQYVLWAGKSAEEALQAALIETVGQA